jgi:hypothetical protein
MIVLCRIHFQGYIGVAGLLLNDTVHECEVLGLISTIEGMEEWGGGVVNKE